METGSGGLLHPATPKAYARDLALIKRQVDGLSHADGLLQPLMRGNTDSCMIVPIRCRATGGSVSRRR